MKYLNFEDPEIRIFYLKLLSCQRLKKVINRVVIEEEKLLLAPGIKPGTPAFLVRSFTTESQRPIFMVFYTPTTT